MRPNYQVKRYKCGFCSQDFAYASDQTELVCCGCHATGSMTAGEAAQAEVRKLAERMTVLEGRVDELCRALRAVAAPEPAPLDKGYWR